MRNLFCASLLCTFALTSSASAHGTVGHARTGVRHANVQDASDALELGRKLAAAEANLRGSILAAQVLISTFAGSDEALARLVVTAHQRDAVVDVLQTHNYLEHLAQLYAAMLPVTDLRNIVGVYDAPGIAGFWRFESAVIAALLTLGVQMEVQLPEAVASDSDDDAIASEQGVTGAVARWFEGLEQQVDMEALITQIQMRTRAADIQDALALAEMPGADILRDVQATARFNSFDRKELESPRLRSALANAVLRGE